MSNVQERKATKRATAKRLPRGKHGGIELLLIQSVDHLGRQGDIVEVKSGYANNYLLPQGLATIATDHHKRMVEKHRAKLEALHAARLEGFRKQAEDLGRLSVTIEANANEEGHLYGSVGPHEIAAALKAHGVTISPDQVRLDGLLKELALYTVKVHLHQDVDAELKVWVVPTAEEGAK
jgi:large subunit ribosomal protein L9